MRPSAAPILLVVAAIATNVLTRGGRDGEPEPERAVPPPVTVVAADTTTPARGAVVHESVAATALRDHARELLLPDGTLVPALNGAVDVAPLQEFWGPFPWSPIIGVERSSAGVDWYRHADGSYSTTQMVWRSDLGREAAMTRVAHPGPEQVPAAGGEAAAGR